MPSTQTIAAVACLALCAVSCGSPPFMHATAPAPPADGSANATVVFLWPPAMCETGGFYTVVDRHGSFLGNLSSGTRFEITLPPGDHLFVAWNPDREAGLGISSWADVAVMEARLAMGHTYYASLGFGGEAYDARSTRPQNLQARRCGYRHPSWIAVSPRVGNWDQIGAWMRATRPLFPDLTAGQESLTEDPYSVTEHLSIAQLRIFQTPSYVRRISTLRIEDGM